MIEYTEFSIGHFTFVLGFKGETLIFLDRKKEDGTLRKDFPKETLKRDDKIGKTVKKQLTEYFSGQRTVFTCPFSFETGTPFQQQVWNVLFEVPFGKTISYSELAKQAGNEKAVRAVATAVGKNPISIIIPCHRIVPKNKTKGIGNYGGGVDMKAFLLKLEGAC